MNLQRILWPKDGICTDIEMYFHSNFKVNLIQRENPCILFQKGGMVTTDTYFNSLSVEKWKKYTSVGSISLHLVISGSFEVVLVNKRFSVGRVSKTVIDRQTLESAGKKEFVLPYNLHEYKGMLTYELRACGLDSVYYGG